MRIRRLLERLLCRHPHSTKSRRAMTMVPKMRSGAFALVDALGFKGIWQREDAAKVLLKLQYLQTFANGMTGEISRLQMDLARHGAPKLAISLFSDTIAIGVFMERSEERRVGKECRSRWS